MMEKCDFVKPGTFDLYYGPMYSGKTEALERVLNPISFLRHKKGLTDFIFIRPSNDKRVQRACKYEHVYVDFKDPSEILKLAEKPNVDTVAIDEIEFFSEEIVKVVKTLLKKSKYVVAAGLDLDFRGESFGEMDKLFYLSRLFGNSYFLNHAVCSYQNCRNIAKRTQRLFRGQPADYYDSVVVVEGEDNDRTYEPRCVKHHFVPGKRTDN